MLRKNSNSNDEEPNYRYDSRKIRSSVCDMVLLNDTLELYRWLKSDSLYRDNRGWSALQIAASLADRKECLELLLEHGANVFCKLDPSASTLMERSKTLYVACEANCEENVLLLLQKGFNPNEKMCLEMSPLYIAVTRDYSNIVTHLLNYGAYVNEKYYQGFTALHLAVKRGNAEIGRILLENGADIQIKDNYGNLSLHLAATCEDINFLGLIIDKKPSIVNAEGVMGLTALQIAIRFDNVKCALYLLGRGAKVKLKMIKSIGLFGTNTHKVELMKQLIKHFKVDDISRECLDSRKSITCEIINLRSAEYLSLLLESGLPKYLLQAPECFEYNRTIFTPLVYVLNNPNIPDEIAEAMMRLLLDNDIIFMDEYSRISTDCLQTKFLVQYIREDRLRRFYQILTNKGVTVDYSLQCLCSITELCINDIYNELHLFYNALDVSVPQLESYKFYIRNSCILEPSLLSMKLVQFVLIRFRADNDMKELVASLSPVYNYLIELTAIFYLRQEDWSECEYVRNTWELFSPVADEFAKSTLKQFCRTKIRQLLRGKSINDDLLNFQRRVDDLQLPTCLKNYLLFKD